MSPFQKAVKRNIRLRLALVGPAGSGKTFTALTIATHLGGSVAVLDTEHGSASKYADEFDFDVAGIESYDPRNYIKVIHEAEKAGYDILVLDSLSHAWMGKDGALEMVDRAAARNKGNSFTGWRDVTPIHNDLVEAMLSAKLHLIVTMRSKVEYVVEKDEKTGKSVPRKVGLQPVQREGLDFEFDVVGDLDEQTLHVSKTRCRAIAGRSYNQPGETFTKLLVDWLGSGEGPPADVAPPTWDVNEHGPLGPADDVESSGGSGTESPQAVGTAPAGNSRKAAPGTEKTAQMHAIGTVIGYDHDALKRLAIELGFLDAGDSMSLFNEKSHVIPASKFIQHLRAMERSGMQPEGVA